MHREEHHLAQGRGEIMRGARGDVGERRGDAPASLLPRRRAEALRRGLEPGIVVRVAIEPVEDRGERLAVAAAEEHGMARGNLGQGAGVGSDGDASLRQRLDHRQPIAFVMRGKHRGIGVAVKGKQRLVVERGKPEHALAEVGMPGEGRKRIVGHPALAADNDKPGVLGGQPVEGLKQERVVLAGLDRPDRQQIAQARKLREGRCAGFTVAGARGGRGKISAELDDARRHGAPKEALRHRAEIAGDACRGGERIVGILDVIGDGLGKGDERVRMADLRQENGDGVVIEHHDDHALRLQPAEQRAAVQGLGPARVRLEEDVALSRTCRSRNRRAPRGRGRRDCRRSGSGSDRRARNSGRRRHRRRSAASRSPELTASS